MMKYWGKFKPILKKIIRSEWFQVSLVLALLIGGFFSRELYTGESLALSTFSEHSGSLHTYPWDRVSSETIRKGYLPLWNPYNALGVPHWANILTACLFPLKLIIYLFPSLFINDLYIILRLFLIGLFVYLFVRSLGLSQESSVFSAISFSLCGCLIYYVNCVGINVHIIFLLLLYLLKNLAEKPTVGSMLLCSLVASLSIFGGNPETTFYYLFFALLFYFFQAFIISQKRRVSFLKHLLIGGFVLTVGLLISTVQIIPFAEFLKRSWSHHPDGIGFFHYPIRQILALLIREFNNIFLFSLGNLKSVYSGSWHSSWEAWKGSYESTSVSMGMYPLGLIVSIFTMYSIAVLKRLPRHAVFFAAFLLISLGLICGLPVFNLIPFFPVFNFTLNFIHAFPIFIFSSVILAGFGLEALLQRSHSSRWFQAVTIGTIFVLIGYILINWHKLAQPTDFFRDFLHSISLAIFFLLAILFLYNLFQKRIIGRKPFAGLIILLAYLNLNLFYSSLRNETHFKLGLDRLSKSQSLKTLTEDSDVFRINSLPGIFLPNLGILFNLSDLRSHSGLFFNRYAKMINLINGHSEEEGRAYHLFKFYMRIRPEKIYSPLLDLLNTKYILSPTTLYQGAMVSKVVSEGKIYSTVESGVMENLFKIAGEEKEVLYQHPPSSTDYSFSITEEQSSLRFALGLDPSVWKPARGDGVHFEIRLGKNGEETLLYSKYIDPKNNPEDRSWCEAELDLSPFQGKFITLKFITDPGPRGNSDSDWAGWGDLRVERKEEEIGSKFELVFDGDIKVYHNRQSFPRAFVVHQAEVMEDEEEILARIGSEKFDFREKVILEEQTPELRFTPLERKPNHLWEGEEINEFGRDLKPTPNFLTGLTPNSTRLTSNSKAKVVDYQANSVKIEARMDEEGFLVLSDTYYPGWRVWVDGREEKIYCADYLLRAVHLSSGLHRVKFVFDPLSFKLGLWMALGTIVCLGGFFVYSKLPRKK